MTGRTPPEDDYCTFYYGPSPDPANASKFAWQQDDFRVFSTPEEAQAWLDRDTEEENGRQ